MKKNILLLLLFFALFFHSPAQTFSLVNIDTFVVDAVGSVPSCHATIKNNSSTGFYVDVLRLVNDTAPNWQTAFCIDVCYPPTTDSARFYLPANFTQGFLLEFFSDTLPDTSRVMMKFKNVSDPSNTFTQHYYGITDLTFGVHESLANTLAVRIFPSPVLSGNEFTFHILEKSQISKKYSLQLFDLLGKKIHTVYGLMQGENRMSLNLEEGLFLYMLQDEKRLLKTGKIVITR